MYWNNFNHTEVNEMNTKKESKTNLIVDLHALRQKGFSYLKISKMIGLPVEKVRKRIRIEKMQSRMSGVF